MYVTRTYRVAIPAEDVERILTFEYNQSYMEWSLVNQAYDSATRYSDTYGPAAGSGHTQMWLVVEKEPEDTTNHVIPHEPNQPWWAIEDWWDEENHDVLLGPISYTVEEVEAYLEDETEEEWDRIRKFPSRFES